MATFYTCLTIGPIRFNMYRMLPCMCCLISSVCFKHISLPLGLILLLKISMTYAISLHIEASLYLSQMALLSLSISHTNSNCCIFLQILLTNSCYKRLKHTQYTLYSNSLSISLMQTQCQIPVILFHIKVSNISQIIIEWPKGCVLLPISTDFLRATTPTIR